MSKGRFGIHGGQAVHSGYTRVYSVPSRDRIRFRQLYVIFRLLFLKKSKNRSLKKKENFRMPYLPVSVAAPMQLVHFITLSRMRVCV